MAWYGTLHSRGSSRSQRAFRLLAAFEILTSLVVYRPDVQQLPQVGQRAGALRRIAALPRWYGRLRSARSGTAALVQVRHPRTGTRSIQNFLKHSPKWNVVTAPHSTTLLLPSGCTSML